MNLKITNQEQEFCGNKYFKWYNNICNKAKDRILEEGIYKEEHHIFPKSIYGYNDFTVYLNAKEHYIVHLVLWWGFRTKFGTKDKRTMNMAYSFLIMSGGNIKSQKRYRVKNANEYSFLRIAALETNKNKIITKETRKNLSKAAKKRFEDPKEREKISLVTKGEKNGMYKHVWTEESLKKSSESHKKENLSEQSRLNISNGHKKENLSEKALKNMSIAAKKRFEDPKEKERQSNIMKEKWKNSDFKEQQSNIVKKRWKNIEYREKMKNATKGRIAWNKGKTDIYNEETLEKMRKNKSRKVSKFDLNNNLIETYNSIKEAAKINKIMVKGIIDCCKCRITFYNNHIWKYINEENK